MKRFENQSAIITGGAEGLGRGIAERIASEGGKVFLFDINQPMLEKTIEDFKGKGFYAEGFAVDVSSESSVVDGIRKVGENTAQVHIMVNAAGIVGLSNKKTVPGSACFITSQSVEFILFAEIISSASRANKKFPRPNNSLAASINNFCLPPSLKSLLSFLIIITLS